VPELDGDAEVGQPLLALLDVGLGLARDHEPLRELKEHGAELARRVQRHQRVAEPLPHFVDDFVGELIPVDVALVGRRLLLQVLVERPRFVGWLVSSEYALMLNVNSGGVRSIHSTLFFSLGGK
jgi:hypothetical protein